MNFLSGISTYTKIVCGDFDNLKISSDVHVSLVPVTDISAAYHKQARALRKQLIRAMEESQRKVHQIKQAYEVLSDTSKRAMYDADLSAAAMLGCARDGSANVDAMKQDTNHTNSTSLAT
ncbi:unnamed protein product [Urochloa humidicola]